MKKRKILIIDDSILNRELLADMLSDFYEVEEVQDGKAAIEILETKRDTFSLVLLDLMMPIMDGYEFLKIMKERRWIEELPVICISSENSSESLRRVYALGASDYFARPFDAETVFHRVENVISLKEKGYSALSDALEMLSSIFYQILKIDLTDDTYTVLKEMPEDRNGLKKVGATLSECLYEMAQNDNVYKEDRQGYLNFCCIENLKKKLESGNDRLVFNYRARVSQEFRWVSMEIIKSIEYRSDHQIAVLYLRDVNDEYLKQLDTVIRRTKDSVSAVTMNVSSGVCISESTTIERLETLQKNEPMDSYVDRISQWIPRMENREDFRQQFGRENLLKCFSEGNNVIAKEMSAYWHSTKTLRMYRVTAEVIRNSERGQIEAILYVTDVTPSYISETIPQLLYKKNFDEIALIDSKRKCMGMNSTEDFDVESYLERECDYDIYVDRIAGGSIPKEERETFKRDTQLEKIKQELDKRERYSFTVHQTDKNGEKRLKNYTYLYLSKKFGVILAAVEDVTEISDQDILTGGYNRQGFIHKVEKILASCEDATRYVVAFFNIKNFKAVNELFGTDNGDVFLRALYEEIQNSPLAPLVTARMEADHFVCLFDRKKLDFGILEKACHRKMTRDGKTLHIYGRCGIYLLCDKKMPIDGMISRAKLAEKYIVDEYAQAYKIYDDSMQSAYIDKATLSGELKDGLEQGQFQVYYQPVINTQTGKIVGAEGLIRWIHPKRGFISPSVFISALEENGHISKLDLYVMRSVYEFQKRRYQKGQPVVPISVNLSWMDFYDERIMKCLKDRCEDLTIPADLCRLEITETSYAAIEEDRNDVLNYLRRSGVQILLDDFGSGYSSFGMLQNYNFDIMKIDRSFVCQIETNPKSRSIIRFIIELAHELGLRLIAEGAETKAQVDFLKESGCDLIQGYYFYKPLPEEEFVKLLEEN